jgi:hypothetical protein
MAVTDFALLPPNGAVVPEPSLVALFGRLQRHPLDAEATSSREAMMPVDHPPIDGAETDALNYDLVGEKRF